MDKVLVQRTFYIAGQRQLRWVTKTVSECLSLNILDGWHCTACHKPVWKTKRKDGTLCAHHLNPNERALCPITVQEKALQDKLA